MTAQKTRMLTAQELVQLRVKVDKTLPIKGTKEFKPSNSWLEKKQIQTVLDERKILLEEERVERLGALARADWDPELNIANVTCRVGRQWKQMGHEVGGKLYLFPEEALFLLETNCLELMYNGVAMSIQQAYSMLLGPDTGCTFNEYQTYMHLVRQGYNLLRHSKSIRATRYERQIRLHQHSVGQKQRKGKENASVQEIVIEDGNNTDIKEHIEVINPSVSERMHNNMKTEEQEIIDVETIEIVDINDDIVSGKSNMNAEVNGVIETIEKQKSINYLLSRRSSSNSVNKNSNPVGPKTTVKNEPAGKCIGIINENESKEALKGVKDETLVQEKDSNLRSVQELNSNHKIKDNSVNRQKFKSGLEIIAPVPGTGTGENEIVVGRISSPELLKDGVSSKLSERESISDITTGSCRTMTVCVETMTASNAKQSDNGICSQDGQTSKETSNVNETASSSTETTEKCDTSTPKTFKGVEPSSDEISDIIFVDDSSTSMDVSQNGKSENQIETQAQRIEREGDNKQRQSENEQDITQTPEKGIADCTDIVDVSDSSETSHHEVKIESSVKIRSDTQNKTSSENSDEIEIVSIVDVGGDADNEIVEVNHNEIPSTSAIRSTSRSRQRKSYRNSVESNVVKKEVQQNKDSIKPDVVDVEDDAVANVTLLSSTQNSNLSHSNDTAHLSGRKVTTIQLEHNEVQITPSIVDISEEEGKQDPSQLKKEKGNSICKSEIEVVDLEDEDIKPELSWEEEREKILDSIPSIDGKFVVHVRVPDKNLLPPNVCPQKEDYYIQKGRLYAPGIGGKLRAELPNDRAHCWQDGQTPQADGQISPWIQNPVSNLGGGGNMFGAAGVWSNSTFPLSGPFMNQHYQTRFPGAFALQTVFHQAAAMLSVLGNPAWAQNRTYGMPTPPLIHQHSRIPYDHRPSWHYQTKPYYRRPYYKRRRWRFESQYHSTPVGLGERHSENQTNGSNDIIPLRVEDETSERATKILHKDEHEAVDDDVIECVSNSPPIKVDNEPMEWTSGEGQRHDSNTNGIDGQNISRRRKRRGSGNPRSFEPPKKLRAFIEKLRLETKEEKRRKRELKDDVEDESEQEVEDVAAADVKSWRDFKTVMQVVVLDSSSEDEDDVHVVVDDIQGLEMGTNGPLVQPEDCKDIGSILKKLQIIKSVNFEQESQAGTNERLKISFDLYMPSATFRKASPGLPNYRITVIGYEDPIPEPTELVALQKDFQDDVPLLFAIVLPDTVTFLQFGSVKLPVETFCP